MRLLVIAAVIFAFALPATARGAKKQPDVDTKKARALFVEGIESVRKAQWAQALDAFDKSAKLRAHAVTTYNIGACERAMGRYTRARASFRSALVRNKINTGELPGRLAADAGRFLKEIDQLLVRVSLSVEPRDARIAVDGAPLAPAVSTDDTPTVVAGLLPSGAGEPLPAKRVTLLLDPGAHVLLLSRKGYGNVAINRSYGPGARAKLQLALDRLPATLHIAANTDAAIVEIDGQAVGFAPIDIERPAGSHEVVVRQTGYVPYKTKLQVKAGEAVNLQAALDKASPNVLEQWWFWTSAGVIVTAAVVGTYFATRPEPTRPALNGGGLGWTVPID